MDRSEPVNISGLELKPISGIEGECFQFRLPNVALFGSSFDPPHVGHTRACMVASELCDQLLVCPTTQNPMKARSCASFDHRLEMSRLFAEEMGWGLWDQGHATTAELLHSHGKTIKNQTQSVVVGMDTMNTIQHWHDFNDIFKSTKTIVISRPGYDIEKHCQHLPSWFLENMTIVCCETVNISSTKLRQLIAQKDDTLVEKYLSPNVLEYIRDNSLYC